jgi:hypothetical protein
LTGGRWPIQARFGLTGDLQISPTLSSRPEQIIAKRRSAEWRDLLFFRPKVAEMELEWTARDREMNARARVPLPRLAHETARRTLRLPPRLRSGLSAKQGRLWGTRLANLGHPSFPEPHTGVPKCARRQRRCGPILRPYPTDPRNSNIRQHRINTGHIRGERRTAVVPPARLQVGRYHQLCASLNYTALGKVVLA